MPDITPEQRRSILDHLNQGNKMAAVKLYRELAGCDLKSAKEFVTQLENALETGEAPDPETNHQLPQETIEQITSLLTRGDLIPAIKVYRTATGTSLRDAKSAVESIAADQGVKIKGSGCGTTVLMFALLTAGLFCLTC